MECQQGFVPVAHMGFQYGFKKHIPLIRIRRKSGTSTAELFFLHWICADPDREVQDERLRIQGNKHLKLIIYVSVLYIYII